MNDLFQIGEFFSISFIVVITYMATHIMMGHLKPVTKALVSMFFGTLAYSIAKVMLITLVLKPFFPNSPY